MELKVGTAVVTRDDGRLALGRLGALCEQVGYYSENMFLETFMWVLNDFIVIFVSYTQIQALNSEGFEVILVSSGAVGAGRQRLRYRKLINSRYLVTP